MQNRCGRKDTQELRSPPEVDCQQPESPQGGPRHLGEACGTRTGTSARGSDQRPAVACAPAPRGHASRLRSGFGSRLRARTPPRARPCARASLCRSRCSSGGCGGAAAAGHTRPRGLPAPRRNSASSSSPRPTRNSHSSRIGDYNTFVQNRAAAGHASIRSFSTKFRVVGSTTTVDARDNTGTTYTASDKGPPIWWLNGSKSRRQLPGFLRRQLGQREREERVGQRPDYRLLRNYWGRRSRRVDRFEQQRHRRKAARRLEGLPIGGNQVQVGALNCSRLEPAEQPKWEFHCSTVARKINSTPCRPVIKLLNEVTVQSVSIPSSSNERHLGLCRGRDHPDPPRFRRDNVSVDGNTLRGAQRRRGGTPRDLRVRLRHAQSELRIHGAGGGLRFERYFAVLKPSHRPGLRSDFLGRRTHLRAVRWSCCRTRPACLGQPVGSQGRRYAEFHPPTPGSVRCPTRARER